MYVCKYDKDDTKIVYMYAVFENDYYLKYINLLQVTRKTAFFLLVKQYFEDCFRSWF